MLFLEKPIPERFVGLHPSYLIGLLCQVSCTETRLAFDIIEQFLKHRIHNYLHYKCENLTSRNPAEGQKDFLRKQSGPKKCR